MSSAPRFDSWAVGGVRDCRFFFAFNKASSNESRAPRLIIGMTSNLGKQMNNVAAKTNDSGWRIVKRKSAGDVSAPIALAMVVHQLLKPIAKPAIYSLE